MAISEARLAECKERFRRLHGKIASVHDVEAGFDLADEVERLRAREAALVEIVSLVAGCPRTPDDVAHLTISHAMSDKARALLASAEADAAAQGEA